ncbi:Ribosome biogenesis protein ERB1 [Dissostichus eleginoides]|uniref:Ribosome biogenesis protein ERB1 n=1 Tax=Dissostichus eleginoides TaxID=100907 RepID=A0AAD9C4V9_DISEL|nr:Ribosome biogenesis protein ERB1 [Dissostichus eleginoides]
MTVLLGVFLLQVEPDELWCVSDGTTSHSYDLSGPELRAVLNSPVIFAERLKRPLTGFPGMFWCASHTGVRVTLANGNLWLVHKGNNFGISSQTVVVAARHMSNAWEVFEKKDLDGTKTVSDFVAVGGTMYDVWDDNCHDASQAMMDNNSPRCPPP